MRLIVLQEEVLFLREDISNSVPPDIEHVGPKIEPDDIVVHVSFRFFVCTDLVRLMREASKTVQSIFLFKNSS